ncbi:MAG: hypothetical protein ABIQ51_00690 [Mesorhizobium sp.]
MAPSYSSRTQKESKNNDIVPIDTLPPLGVPNRMFAQTIHSTRLGDPIDAFKIEEIEIPTPGEGEASVAVMAAGLDVNNLWARQGRADRHRDAQRHRARPTTSMSVARHFGYRW